MARPAPLAPVGAPAGQTEAGGPGRLAPGEPVATGGAGGTGGQGGTDGGPGPSDAERFFAPAVLQPVPRVLLTESTPFPTASGSGTSGRGGTDSRNWLVLVATVVFLVGAVATAWFTFGSAAKHERPVVLPPKAPTAGLPTSLDAIVRIQAESSRRNAIQAVEQIGGGDPGRLASVQPNYAYIGGDQASTDPHTVSVGQRGSTVTVAVSASNKDICAYAQWAPNATPLYVTMAHEPSCAATTAPTVGWSTEAGGAASDLPDDLG